MMNIEMIRKLYDYHFAVNRRLWESCVMALSDAQFTQEDAYSAGSVKGQVVHLITWDEQWFARLREETTLPVRLQPDQFANRGELRAYWDNVETVMRVYLAELTEDTFAGTVHIRSQTWGEVDLPVWQILLHVVNHATDHRAQTLRLLDQLGAPTFEQDFMIYLWGWGRGA